MSREALDYLKTRFRAAVDDKDIDPTDQSGLLWSDLDVLDYINIAHEEFVRDTRYKRGVVPLTVVAGDPVVVVPESIIEPRYEQATLVNHGVTVCERNINEAMVVDDYGQRATTNLFMNGSPGVPRVYTFDHTSGELRLYPTPTMDDELLLPAYLEASEVCDFNDSLDIRKQRHIRMLLAGMMREAYLKQDADVYSPDQAARYAAMFESSKQQTKAEITRRTRTPGQIVYGGL